MRRIRELLLLATLGALVSAILTVAAFIVLVGLDGGRLDEALAFGVLFSIPPAIIGAVTGLLVGILRATVWGGLASATAIVIVILLVMGVMAPGSGLALDRMYVPAIVLTPPTVVAGVFTGWLRSRRARARFGNESEAIAALDGASVSGSPD